MEAGEPEEGGAGAHQEEAGEPEEGGAGAHQEEVVVLVQTKELVHLGLALPLAHRQHGVGVEAEVIHPEAVAGAGGVHVGLFVAQTNTQTGSRTGLPGKSLPGRSNLQAPKLF